MVVLTLLARLVLVALAAGMVASVTWLWGWW